MKRRDLLKAALAIPFLPGVLSGGLAVARGAAAVMPARFRPRVRPGDPAWPSVSRWDQLKHDVGGRLLKLESPFAGCGSTPAGRGSSWRRSRGASSPTSTN